MSGIYYRKTSGGEWIKRDLDPPKLDTGYEEALANAIGEAQGIKGLALVQTHIPIAGSGTPFSTPVVGEDGYSHYQPIRKPKAPL